MATPNFEAYSAGVPRVSPALTGVQTGLQTYASLQQLQQQRQQQQRLQQQQQLAQQQEQRLEQQAAMNQKIQAHSLAASRLNDLQATHVYLSHRLADIAYLPKKDRPAAYTAIRNDLNNIGFPVNDMPKAYNDKVDKYVVASAMATPTAQADRKFHREITLQELKNRGALQVAQTRLGGRGIGVRGTTQQPTVGGQIITPLGGSPAAQTPPGTIQQQPPIAPRAQGPYTTQAPQAMAPTAPVAAAHTQTGAPTGIKIQPGPQLAKGYQLAAGKAFSDEQKAAIQTAQASQDAVYQIDQFVAAASKSPISTGPLAAHILPYTAQGQLGQKAAIRLGLALLKKQHFTRPTNLEMQRTGKATLGLSMRPEAWKELAPQLRVLNQRSGQYGNFLNAANMLGITNIGIARRIWNRYKEENPLVNADGSVNPKGVYAWKRYLTPQALQTELIPSKPNVSTEKTYLGPDGKQYTHSELQRIAAQGRRK